MEGEVTQSLHNVLQTQRDMLKEEINEDLRVILDHQRNQDYELIKCSRKINHYKAVLKEVVGKVGGISIDVSDSDSDGEEEHERPRDCREWC